MDNVKTIDNLANKASENQADNSFRHTACPLCQKNNLDKVGQINYFRPTLYASSQVSFKHIPELWKCNNCLSCFTQNILSESESISLYNQQDAYVPPSYISSFEKLKPQPVINFLQEILKPDQNVLDIGCNDGLFLDFAKQYKCKTFGIEYSLSCQKRLNEKGHTTYSKLRDVQESYDLITAFDLVEHIYDLPSFLEECLTHLKDNGYILFHTGDILSQLPKIIKSRWWYVRYAEHIVFPSKQYFMTHPKVTLEQWIPTYANVHYQSITNIAKFLVKELIPVNFSGAHWLIPDHALIILRAKR
ncbi:MAG: class I SAM-dependent methyltransferase [Waterburya sp.]